MPKFAHWFENRPFGFSARLSECSESIDRRKAEVYNEASSCQRPIAPTIRQLGKTSSVGRRTGPCELLTGPLRTREGVG